MRYLSALLVVFIALFFGQPHIALANCQGCCSWHNGVCCIGGVTKCCDGTSLSSTCKDKGCSVCPSGPNASFSANPLSGDAPLVVNFYDKSTGGVSNWSWDFGDGEEGSDKNPTHTYLSEGTYDVTLTVSNSSGSDTSTKYAYILVQASIGFCQSAVDIGNGWQWLAWFGYFNVNSPPWIYHEDHEWLYPFGECEGSIVFWDVKMEAFWWTDKTSYPYVYRFSDNAWLWYQQGTSDPRWFYNYSTLKWEEK